MFMIELDVDYQCSQSLFDIIYVIHIWIMLCALAWFRVHDVYVNLFIMIERVSLKDKFKGHFIPTGLYYIVSGGCKVDSIADLS